jgi:hypothetical protein
MNNVAEAFLFAGGVYNLGFVIFHLMFWRIFCWKKDLASLTFTNRQVMQILNLCIIFVFLVIAYVSFFHVTELLRTGLGTAMLIAFSLFWFLRAIEQIVFFGLRNRASLILTIVFLLGTAIYLMPLLLDKPW